AEPGPAPQAAGAAAVAVATPAEGELRPVTVLFADISGFTALSGTLDAEEVHGLLNRFFEAVDGAVESHGGVIDKHIGDAVIALFGAPVAHSDDPQRAVRAALAIHAAMAGLGVAVGRRLQAHVGLASGQVVASGTGSARHRAYTVTGESVNLASRLTALARPGETLISQAVRDAVGGLVEAEPAGDAAIKGFERPVRVWRLRGLRAGAAEAPSGPFVGRRTELAQFEGMLAACLETGQGGALHIRGEAGIGKTRLVEEMRRRAAARGFACHLGLVLDFGSPTGRDAVRALVRSMLGIGPTSAPPAVLAAAERALAEGLADTDAAPYLNDLLDLPQPREARALYDAADPATRRLRLCQTAARLVERAAGRRPLLLVVEDVHWADTATLDHLTALGEAVARCPAILIMTARLEADPLDRRWRAAAGHGPLVTMDLAPLRPTEAMALAGALGEADQSFRVACVERAEGNPLFLEQLLRSAADTGAAGLPPSVQSVVLARVDSLPPADRRALQAASVLGQRFAVPALRHLIASADYDCATLIERHLVRPHGEEMLFVHALIREGVYGSLLKARRRALHRLAADWFAGRDRVLAAEHLDRAEDPGAPRAYLEAAQEQAAAFRPEAALGLVERGLALAEGQASRADRFAMTCLRGEVLHDLGRMAESIEAYEAALAVAADDAERCRAWLGAAGGRRVLDRLDEAFGLLAQAEAAAESAGLLAERARIHHLRGNLHFPRGDMDGCRREHERSLAFAERAGSPALTARALGGLGDAMYVVGRMLTALDLFRRCVALAREHGLGRIEIANRPMISATLGYTADMRGARDEALAAVEAAARVGQQRAEIVARECACFALLELGELDEARTQAERSLAVSSRLGARRFEAEDLTLTAEALRRAGERGEALALARRALAICRETVMAYQGPIVLAVLAASTDDAAERDAALAEAGALLDRGAVSHNHTWMRGIAIELTLALGHWDAAEAHAAALAAYMAPEPTPFTDMIAALGRLGAAWGRGQRKDGLRRRLEALRADMLARGLAPMAGTVARVLAA
ncbi:MAG: AAA family ATPase, partial [Rhodospirillaceae bacterium]|nr:AAA family ATPase [Rhodospirillaceae bacterium]